MGSALIDLASPEIAESPFRTYAWLREEGYLKLKDGEEGGAWYAGVDWEQTQAYALGLSGIPSAAEVPPGRGHRRQVAAMIYPAILIPCTSRRGVAL